jgi:linoleoyl-CoA desaturase
MSAPRFMTDADGFHSELRRRVNEYFSSAGLSQRDSSRMYLKTMLMLLWFVASWSLLVFAASSVWQVVLLGASLVLAMGGVGFSTQHDGNHGAYSRHEPVNRLMGMGLDLLGASSYLWRWRHNVAHHSYPNLSGADDDIDVTPFARLAPDQPWYRFHRWQAIYLWVLYGLLVTKWQFVSDVQKVVHPQIAAHRVPRPRGWSLLQMVVGKAVFVGWAIVIPALVHPWWVVLVVYAAISFTFSLLLSVTFQLAHCVEEAVFIARPSAARELPRAWARHQVQSTVDFAPRNRWLTWYLGGLNYQIEHHLFPKISHVHYPQIARIVQEVCTEFGVGYRVHDGLLDALTSHVRWLHRMGNPRAQTP